MKTSIKAILDNIKSAEDYLDEEAIDEFVQKLLGDGRI